MQLTSSSFALIASIALLAACDCDAQTQTSVVELRADELTTPCQDICDEAISSGDYAFESCTRDLDAPKGPTVSCVYTTSSCQSGPPPGP